MAKTTTGKTRMADTPGRMKEYMLLNEGAKSLSSNYVYYETLKDEPTSYMKNISYSDINSLLQRYRDEIDTSLLDSSKVRAMAEIELNKEIRLLKEKFGKDLDAESFLQSPNFDKDKFATLYKDLNKAINTALGFEKVYERNITLIKTSKKRKSKVTGEDLTGGKKSIITYYPTYLEQQLQEDLVPIRNDIVKIIKQNNNNPANMEQQLKNYLTSKFRDTCKNAAIRMFSSERALELEAELSLSMSPEEIAEQRKAYEELRLCLENFSPYSSNSTASYFLNQLFELYHIQEVIDDLTKEIVSTKSIQTTLTKNRGRSKKKFNLSNNKFFKGAISVGIDSRGGTMLELVENLTTNELMKIKGVQGGSFHSGSTGNMKADNIITVDIDTSLIAQSLQNTYSQTITNQNTGEDIVGREKNVYAIEQLHNDLKGIYHGFIIYSSAKNYTYNEKFGGFSAGEAQTLENFTKMINGVHRTVRKNFRSLAGLILQLSNGAIGHNILSKEKIEDLLAQGVAYFLFDDFETIGYEKSRATNYLHLMNLNGVYVPLSFILFLLAEAIDKAKSENMLHRIVNVSVKTPDEVLYKKTSPLQSWINVYGNNPPSVAWNEQRRVAQQESTISIHFLKDFQKIITEFF